ncbi:MAG: amidohydrolase family protein [Myxococcota bacterium]
MDSTDTVLNGSILIKDGIIKSIGRINKKGIKSTCEVIDAEGAFVLPGFIQTHIHTGQTLFRGMADDLDLLEWLSKHIWRYEAAHNKESVYASARLSILEMISSGTTTFLDIGLVHNVESIFMALKESGARGVVCKMLMDSKGHPEGLGEDITKSESEIRYLFPEYHRSEGGRLMLGIGPRFALSVSKESLIRASGLAKELGLIITTHSSENIREVMMVKDLFNDSNIAYLYKCGLLNKNSIIAHCIWLERGDYDLLRDTQTSVAHCPSANLKLASGFARIPEMLESGINVTLGADGAPCNNNLNMLTEMRIAALIHKPRVGPKKMDAKSILKMATINGAKALGLDDEIGSIEIGKKADLIVIRNDSPHMNPFDNPYSAIVYSSDRSDVSYVIVDGRIIYRDGWHFQWDRDEVVKRAVEEKKKLLKRL